MIFLETAKGVSFYALALYVALVVIARVSGLRRLDELSLLGITTGSVVGVGLGAQLGLAGFWGAMLMGLSVGGFGFLFRLLKTRFPTGRAA